MKTFLQYFFMIHLLNNISNDEKFLQDNSEAIASEKLGNREEINLCCSNDQIISFKYSISH